MVAQQVLDALNLGGAETQLDAELSERYHEVGFTVGFPQPSDDVQLPMDLDTSQLQSVTSDLEREIWRLSPQDPPVSMAIASKTGPVDGSGVGWLASAIVVIASLGLAAGVAIRRHARQSQLDRPPHLPR